MDRDLDLVRLLLLEVEGSVDINLDGYGNDQIMYHRGYIIDAGLARGVVHRTSRTDSSIPDMVHISQLTQDGHDFAEASNSDSIWAKAKEAMLEKGLGLTVDAALAVLKSISMGTL